MNGQHCPMPETIPDTPSSFLKSILATLPRKCDEWIW